MELLVIKNGKLCIGNLAIAFPEGARFEPEMLVVDGITFVRDGVPKIDVDIHYSSEDMFWADVFDYEGDSAEGNHITLSDVEAFNCHGLAGKAIKSAWIEEDAAEENFATELHWASFFPAHDKTVGMRITITWHVRRIALNDAVAEIEYLLAQEPIAGMIQSIEKTN